MDSTHPFPSHKHRGLYIDNMPAVLLFLLPNGWWLWRIDFKLIFMLLKTVVWKKMKQGTIIRCLVYFHFSFPIPPPTLSSTSETAYFFWYNKHSGEMSKMKNFIITALIFKCTRTAILCPTAFAFIQNYVNISSCFLIKGGPPTLVCTPEL